jgi:hypothetical protein
MLVVLHKLIGLRHGVDVGWSVMLVMRVALVFLNIM